MPIKRAQSGEAIPVVTNTHENNQHYIDIFRSQEECGTPDEWLNYIKLVAKEHHSHTMYGFSIVDFVPQPPNQSVTLLRSIIRPDESYKPGTYKALLILRQNHIDVSRLALVYGKHHDSPLYARKAIIHNDNVRTNPLPVDNSVLVEFDRLLKIYRPADEIRQIKAKSDISSLAK